MSVDEPTPGELSRLIGSLRGDVRNGFAAVNTRLDKFVTTELFSADQRRVDERLKDLADDITAEREARVAALKDEQRARVKAQEDQQKGLDKLTTNLRWVAVSIILPIGLFVANLALGR